MSAIGKGDWVEYTGIPAGTGSPAGIIALAGSGFRRRVPYLVADVGYQGGEPWVSISGMPTPMDFGYPCPGWAAGCFRPVYRPKADFIESLKAPPIRQTQDA